MSDWVDHIDLGRFAANLKRPVCDVCGKASSREEFDAHDPSTKQNYVFCSVECVKAQDRALKMERRLTTDPRAGTFDPTAAQRAFYTNKQLAGRMKP